VAETGAGNHGSGFGHNLSAAADAPAQGMPKKGRISTFETRTNRKGRMGK